MRIVVIGAGGHARSVCDVLLQAGAHQVVGLIDGGQAEGFFGLPVLGGDDILPGLLARGEAQGALVGIGSNAVRRRITASLMEMGYEMVTAISPRAFLSAHASIGAGSVMMPGAVAGPCCRIGEGCILNTNCNVDHDTMVEDFCHIAPGVSISGNVHIGDGSFLGTGANVIDGIRIGQHVMLGAGGVAVRDIPEGCTAVGVPARIIK